METLSDTVGDAGRLLYGFGNATSDAFKRLKVTQGSIGIFYQDTAENTADLADLTYLRKPASRWRLIGSPLRTAAPPAQLSVSETACFARYLMNNPAVKR